MERVRQQALIAPFQRGRQRRLAPLDDAPDAREQIGAERRGQGEGDDQRREQRDEIGETERLQQSALDPREEEERQEHQHHDRGREDDGAADLPAGAIDDLQRRALLFSRETGVLPEPPRDVLDIDDGVVDERADGDGHPAQGHAVDRQAREAKTNDGGQQRQRNRHQRDGAGAQVGEEHEGHEHDQIGSVAQRVRQIGERELEEIRLSEQARVEPHPRRQIRPNLIEHRVELTGQRQCVDVGLALNAEDHRRLSVARSVTPLERRALPQFGHVTHVERSGIVDADNGRADRVEVAQPSDTLNEVLLPAGDPEAGRRVPIRPSQRRLDRTQRYPVIGQPLGVDQHLELPPLAAEDRDLRHAGGRQQPPPHEDLGRRP